MLGEDVVERMILFHLIVSPDDEIFERIVNHGLLWGSDEKKMSRFASNSLRATEVVSDPDIIRFSILSRPIQNGIKIQNLQIPLAQQLHSQFKRIMQSIQPCNIKLSCSLQLDEKYVKAVNELDFQALSDWFRVLINKDLRDLTIKTNRGVITSEERVRLDALCNLIGNVLFPRAYAQLVRH